MITVRTVAEVRAATRGKGRVGLVPTMGAFHEGHLSLIRAARGQCDCVVVWLFVNPSQFNEASDLEAYPRDEQRDATLAAGNGADILFAPTVDEVYPEGFATTINVAGLGDVYEGEHRPGHFAGVATVVAKMLNMVGPAVAFFGAKDAQQVALVRRMAADLDIPTEIAVLPIIRDPDGMAMSSRNVHLSSAEREQAAALSRGLRAAAAAGRAQAADVLLATLRDAGVEPEYIALVDPDTFMPLAAGRRLPAANGRALLAVAARVGTTRLIDNIEVTA